jgi:hypothetical protein
MAYDPNWLYSSAAQSGAALVAIMGGYLLTRVITITAERATVDNELGLLAEQRPVRVADLEHHQSRINDFEAWDIIEDHWERLADVEPPTTNDLALNKVDADDGVHALLDERRAALLSSIELIRKAIEELHENGGDVPTYYEDLWNEDPTADPYYGEKFFERFRSDWRDTFKKRDEAQRKAEAAARRRLGGLSGFDYSAMSGLLDSPEMMRLNHSVELPHTHRPLVVTEYNNHVRRRNEIRSEISSMDVERDSLERRRAALVTPPGTRLGFGSLLTFAVTGIALPIGVLLFQPSGAWQTVCMWSVAVGFMFGLALVLNYIRWSLKHATSNN